MTDARCRSLISDSGKSLNPMSGIEGTFYTTNREADLMTLVREIVRERDGGSYE